MRNLRTWCLGVLAVAGVVAGCSNTTSNGGGYFLDAKSGCADAKSPCGGITPTADGESLDVDPDSALTADALTDLADSGADDSGAELTGPGLGELYGFFASSNPPSVRRIDKTTGKTNVQSWNLPTSTFGQEGDVAFAQWGGAFYLFYQGPADSSTNVWKLDTATGVATKVKANTGYTIVGAGVSSCAPTKAP